MNVQLHRAREQMAENHVSELPATITVLWTGDRVDW